MPNAAEKGMSQKHQAQFNFAYLFVKFSSLKSESESDGSANAIRMVSSNFTRIIPLHGPEYLRELFSTLNSIPLAFLDFRLFNIGMHLHRPLLWSSDDL